MVIFAHRLLYIVRFWEHYFWEPILKLAKFLIRFVEKYLS